MEILLLGIALFAFDILALRFGTDSRYGPERDPKTLGIKR
jgi:hypothetical protein